MFYCDNIIDKYNDKCINDCFVFAYKIPIKFYNYSQQVFMYNLIKYYAIFS